MNDREKFVRQYFTNLTAGDTAAIIAMFDNEATVNSPFLGVKRASDFFAKLDQASAASKLTVFDVLFSAGEKSAAAHFEYDWTLASGDRFSFQGVDYFQFSTSGKFASMSIFYDTHPVREIVGDKYA